MEALVKAFLFEHTEIKQFNIRVSEDQHKKVKLKLEETYKQMVNYLKDLQKEGVIKSVWRPKNKQIQKHLNELIQAKRDIKKSIESMKEVFGSIRYK